MRKNSPLVLVSLIGLLMLTGCGAGRDNSSKPASAASLIQSGLVQLNAGKADEALATFREAAKKDPKSPVAHYNVGVVLQQKGDVAGALAAYGEALVASPDYVPALYNSAIIYKDADPTLAIATFRRILKLQPIAPTTYLNLGLLEAKAGQEAQARKDLTKAIEQDGSLVTSIPKDVFSKTGPTTTKPSASRAPTATPSP